VFRNCLFSDPPIEDPRFPPFFQAPTLLSGGCDLYGVFYGAQGKGPRPAMLFLHGFPGNEKNIDLAQIIRRAGFHAFIFSYRGAWGSRGSFSFSNVVEDSRIAVEFLRSDEARDSFNVDGDRILLAGHSMGGFAAIKTAEMMPFIRDTLFLSGWNIGLDGKHACKDPDVEKRVRGIVESAAPRLAGTSVETLWNEIMDRKDEYDLLNSTAAFSGRGVFLAGASRDEAVPPGMHHDPLLRAFRGAGNVAVESVVLEDDHSYSGSRIALAEAVLEYLEKRGY